MHSLVCKSHYKARNKLCTETQCHQKLEVLIGHLPCAHPCNSWSTIYRLPRRWKILLCFKPTTLIMHCVNEPVNNETMPFTLYSVLLMCIRQHCHDIHHLTWWMLPGLLCSFAALPLHVHKWKVKLRRPGNKTSYLLPGRNCSQDGMADTPKTGKDGENLIQQGYSVIRFAKEQQLLCMAAKGIVLTQSKHLCALFTISFCTSLVCSSLNTVILLTTTVHVSGGGRAWSERHRWA